jgi:phage terminase small subunit
MTDEHKRNGTYRADRHDVKLAAIPFAQGIPEPVEKLTDTARQLWDDVVAQVPERLLSTIDWAAMTQMCRWYGIAADLTSLIAADPLEVKLYAPANMAARNFAMWAQRFGLSPLDRTRVRADQNAKDKKSPLEQLQAMRNGGMVG